MAKPRKSEPTVTEEPVVEEVVQAPRVGVAAKPQASTRAGKEFELVSINVSYPVHINGVRYEGKCQVQRHVAESIAEMVQKKRKADLEIFTGRNFVQRFLANGDRIISPEVKKDE